MRWGQQCGRPDRPAVAVPSPEFGLLLTPSVSAWHPLRLSLLFSAPQPTKKRTRENWELPYYVGMGACVIAAYVVAAHGPNTSLVHWAREEALHTGFKAPEVAPDLED